MNVTLAAKDEEITEAMRDKAQEKADWLARHFEFLKDMNITLKHEGRRYTAEFVAKTRKSETFVASAETEDMYKTLEAVTDKITNQLHKFKERIKKHRVPKPDKEVM